MSADRERVLRVALLSHGADPAAAQYVRDLAAALREAGHAPHVIAPARGGGEDAVDSILRRRGFTAPLAHVPRTVAALVRGRYQVAHAFSASDARAALAWSRFASRPVLFTCTERIDRGTVADGRLRLSFLSAAVEATDAVIAADDEVRAGLHRWLAFEAPVVRARDAASHERTYRRLLGHG